MKDHATTASRGTKGNKLEVKNSTRDRLLTIRAATLYLIGLLALVSLFPIPVRILEWILMASVILSLIGIGSTLVVWWLEAARTVPVERA